MPKVADEKNASVFGVFSPRPVVRNLETRQRPGSGSDTGRYRADVGATSDTAGRRLEDGSLIADHPSVESGVEFDPEQIVGRSRVQLGPTRTTI